LIIRRAGSGFVVHHSKYALCLDVNDDVCNYAVGIFDEGDSYYACPLGKICQRPTEGWLDLLPFSVLITPRGAVVTDGRTSAGFWKVPEAVHVDFVVGESPYRGDAPFQDVRLLEEDDHIEPFGAAVLRSDDVHRMKLEERWFELIASGEKVVEGRVYDEKRKRLRVGHVIQFKSVQSGKLLYAKVKKLVMYKNFKEMLESEDRVLPGLSVEEGLKVYEKYYGPEAGPALAIGLEVL